MSDVQMKKLGKLWSVECFSKFIPEEKNMRSRVIIDDNWDALKKSTKYFEDIDLCQADLTNNFTTLQKLAHQHMMSELEY